MKAWRWVALASVASGGACAIEAGPTGGASPESFTNEADLLSRKCAGPDALTCRTGKFCAASEANRCPGLEITGTCRRVPEVCVEIYQPACGCDGQTYGNECEAARASVAVAYDGPCAPFCGGFAGLACPGSGTCVDNPTDGCDPSGGGADCASLCRCEVEDFCDEGARWDSSPEVCACVWE
jgi:hypothetical protein